MKTKYYVSGIHYISGSSFIQNKTTKSIKNPNYSHLQFPGRTMNFQSLLATLSRGQQPTLGVVHRQVHFSVKRQPALAKSKLLLGSKVLLKEKVLRQFQMYG